MSHRPPRLPLRTLSGAALAALAAVSLGSARHAAASDIDLLRFNSGKPYVFLILDTSTSMNLSIDGE